MVSREDSLFSPTETTKGAKKILKQFLSFVLFVVSVGPILSLQDTKKVLPFKETCS